MQPTIYGNGTLARTIGMRH